MCESDDGLVVALSLVSFTVVVGTTNGVGANDRERGKKQGTFETFVATMAYSFRFNRGS